MISQLKTIVLAAGKGSRLQAGESDAPKVMRLARGKPLLWHVLNALPAMPKEDVVIVVGYGKEQVIGYFDGYVFAEQAEQLGTGHAVMAASGQLSDFNGAVLICYGDMPLIKGETYEAFLKAHFEQGNDCTILTGETTLDLPFGRIVRDADGIFLCVVEDRDCTPEQRMITELNTGVYVFNAPLMLAALKEVKNNNAQGEYYLTDVPEILRKNGARVGLFRRNLGDEILGVNTLEQLEQVEEILCRNQGHVNSDCLKGGVACG
ncbi:MAG: NTP transferase domain-containing protein [Oscillospiraceae bacterium]|nr:NTP transferase domain-containing protein [Oscillospiraceae bacterium]